MKKLLLFFICLSTIPVFVQATDLVNTSKLSTFSYNATINESDIDIIVNPEFPSAFEDITLRLDSNSIDLNRYTIQWVTDSFEQKSGVGLRDFIVRSGGYGSRKKITVTITGQGTRIIKNVIIAPQDATLLWEAVDSYVPAFYYGKKLAGQESLIQFSALPNFRSGLKSTQLGDAVFLWSRNGNRVLNAGGYEKNSLLIQHNKLRHEEKITVDVSDISGTIKTQKTVTVPIRDPQINWYYRGSDGYKKPVAINNGLLVGSEDVTLVAEPYFFSLDTINDLDFTWKMGDEQLYLDPLAPKNELLVRNPNGTGKVPFTVSIENPRTFLQNALRSTTLFFQKPSE